MLRLHANEHPQGPPAGVAEALHALVPDLHRYPTGDGALQAAIAELHDVPLNRVLIGAGSAEIIGLAWRAFTGPDRAAFFHEPEFDFYPMLGAQCGTPTVTRPWPPDEHLADHVLQARAGLVALSNPHNPTGGWRPRQEIADLAGRLPDTTVVLNDEAYHDYADEAEAGPSLKALSELPNLLTTRTFSKIHGLAGLRVGYGIGHARLIGVLRSLQTPFTVSSAACSAALASLADPASWKARRTRNREQREALAGELAGRGFEVAPSQANFLYVRPPHGTADWAADLLDRGVRVHPVGAALRVTVGSAAETAALVAAVDDILISSRTQHLGEP
ncbi:pyridoxal phosphate-dependent aminotransferase [Kitasatospora sp. DSM 101779]|uniref:pyridoxal phosphate-dependent aminotransferase n=1 Tax=Kitasatospora sp. DSM 101779 TaxID=2853165 RepID=UPI0021DADE18|nr:aminotransferase class I/II-fold pyridoxal phosphate-dependent enzyme [Kitasatospora sp. DSM 101779]MCU7821281.1 aminotransferase class I/II-fold pyridoxal phosphate-dependent enzyme [Kitasatospora sp. DSM 101779]